MFVWAVKTAYQQHCSRPRVLNRLLLRLRETRAVAMGGRLGVALDAEPELRLIATDEICLVGDELRRRTSRSQTKSGPRDGDPAEI